MTEIGVVPVATLLKQPGMRFPAIAKETLPATETDAVMVIKEPFDMESATVSAAEIGVAELLVIVLVDMAAISLPAKSTILPAAVPALGVYVK